MTFMFSRLHTCLKHGMGTDLITLFSENFARNALAEFASL